MEHQQPPESTDLKGSIDHLFKTNILIVQTFFYLTELIPPNNSGLDLTPLFLTLTTLIST